MTNHIISVFTDLYSGRKRLFPTEYSRTLCKIILSMFVFIFIAAAGAFFRLHIGIMKNHIVYILFIFIGAAGAFFQLKFVEHDDKSYYYLLFYFSL